MGDRFIFQSEVLFESGSADIGTEGLIQLANLSRILLDITKDIPNDIPWVLQIQGHTDQNPINTPIYPSNWELSTARANSVLKFLLNSGFAPNRLSAAGYGEFYPITNGDKEEDLDSMSAAAI